MNNLSIREKLNNFSVNSSTEDFLNLFLEIKEVINLTDAELASHLCVGILVIGRWSGGVSCPHPLGRKIILNSMWTLILN